MLHADVIKDESGRCGGGRPAGVRRRDAAARSRGFGIVQMASQAEAHAAIGRSVGRSVRARRLSAAADSLNGNVLDGRQLEVRYDLKPHY